MGKCGEKMVNWRRGHAESLGFSPAAMKPLARACAILPQPINPILSVISSGVVVWLMSPIDSSNHRKLSVIHELSMKCTAATEL